VEQKKNKQKPEKNDEEREKANKQAPRRGRGGMKKVGGSSSS
jgi:hypothetical protein